MVDINIGNGQGITQAIRDKIGAQNIKNKDLETWQAVVSLVDSAKSNKNDSIFKKQGTNGASFTTDKNKIADKSSYQTNYVVSEGKVSIDKSVWDKIEALLTGSKKQNVGLKGEVNFNESLNELNKKEDKNEEFKEIDENKAKAENKEKAKADFEKSLHANPMQNSVNMNTNIKNIQLATGKQITRSVNGKPQTIEIVEVNGQKVRFAVNNDGTRGEPLVTVTTTGKNTYQTQSDFDKTVRSTLGLKEGQNLPDNLRPFYVEIGGSPQLMFKSDNGTLTPKQAADYCKQHVAQGTGEYEGKSIKDITSGFAKKIDYSKLPSSVLNSQPNGAQLNFGGKMYTVQSDNGAKVFVDDNGDKFKAENGKLVPIKTETTEPTQTHIKSGNLNFDSLGSNISEPWTKRGPLDE